MVNVIVLRNIQYICKKEAKQYSAVAFGKNI